MIPFRHWGLVLHCINEVQRYLLNFVLLMLSMDFSLMCKAREIPFD